MGRKKHVLATMELGEARYFDPNGGETLEAAKERLWRRGRAYREQGMAFRFTIDGERVRAERVKLGEETEIGLWLSMKPGDMRILKVDFDPSEEAAAHRRAEYLRRRRDLPFFVYRARERDGALGVENGNLLIVYRDGSTKEELRLLENRKIMTGYQAELSRYRESQRQNKCITLRRATYSLLDEGRASMPGRLTH